MAHNRNRIFWSPRAEQDLIEIREHFARVASPDVADRLLHEIGFATDHLATDPRMWRVRRDVMPDPPGGLRSIPVHPYVVFYRIAPQSPEERMDVEIIRVLHQRRDLPAHFEGGDDFG